MLADCSAFLIGNWSFLLLLLGASLLVGYSEIIFTFRDSLTHWRCFFSLWAWLFVGSYAVVSCLSAALLYELQIYVSFTLGTGLLLGLSGPTLLKLRFFQPLSAEDDTPKRSTNIALAWRMLCFANLNLAFLRAHSDNLRALKTIDSSSLQLVLKQSVGEPLYQAEYRAQIDSLSDDADKHSMLASMVSDLGIRARDIPSAKT